MEIHYCSRKCQKRHWRVHRRHCSCTIQVQTSLSGALYDAKILRTARLWLLRRIVRKAMAIPDSLGFKLVVGTSLLTKDFKLYQIFDQRLPILCVLQQSTETDSDSLPTLIDSDS